jgi:hypothetical protein
MSLSNVIVLIIVRPSQGPTAQVAPFPPLRPQTLQPPQLIRPVTDISDQNKQEAFFSKFKFFFPRSL